MFTVRLKGSNQTFRSRLRLLIRLMVGASVCALAAMPKDATGQTRTYYIAPDEVTWDYAPGGVNRITGQPFGAGESFWVASRPHQVGKVFKKALYGEYTDLAVALMDCAKADGGMRA